MRINWAKAGEVLTHLANALPEQIEYKLVREPTVGNGVLIALRSREPRYGFDAAFTADELENQSAEELAEAVIRDVNDFLKRYRIPRRDGHAHAQ
jgi:hypothetical protein